MLKISCGLGSLTPIKRSKLVTFAEVLAYFQSADLRTQMVRTNLGSCLCQYV